MEGTVEKSITAWNYGSELDTKLKKGIDDNGKLWYKLLKDTKKRSYIASMYVKLRFCTYLSMLPLNVFHGIFISWYIRM